MSKNVSIFCYSLPRFISPAIQCSFCTYFWELYTGEFGWSKAEYGIVSSLYNVIQIVSFVTFGAIFDFITSDQGKWTKGIEVIGTVVHWLTYFFLIFLPIRWHGVKTPYVDSMLGNTLRVWTLDFWRPMFKGPVPLSSMASSWFWWIIFGFPWCFVKLFWVILYLPMKVCFFCGGCLMGFFRIMFYRRTKITSALPVLETLESIPPPACSACCNTTCCNNFAMRMRHARQFMGTRTFRLYMITLVHGIGMSAHELSNKALEGFGNLDNAINCNLSFFFASNIVVYLIFSLLKLYIRSRAFFAETFYLFTIVFFVLQIPILPIFCLGTNEGDAPTAGQSEPNFVNHYLLLFALTVFHGTIVFLIFSGGPLINYVSLFILGGHKVLMSFGVLVLFGALNVTSWIQMIPNVTDFTKKPAHQIIASVCVPLQAVTFLILFPHDWWWNKGNWLNILLFIVTGIVNSVFVSYANIMMSTVAKSTNVRKRRWLFLGIFYAGTNAIVFPCMLIMFNSFGQNEMRQCCCITFKYCFPMIYRTITFVFIVLNGIALAAVWLLYNDTYLPE